MYVEIRDRLEYLFVKSGCREAGSIRRGPLLVLSPDRMSEYTHSYSFFAILQVSQLGLAALHLYLIIRIMQGEMDYKIPSSSSCKS
jgi:hypothetical protein